MIPNRWLSVSRHVGLRLNTTGIEGEQSPSASGSEDVCGVHNRTSADRSEMGQIDRSRRRRGCAGARTQNLHRLA